MTNSGTESIEAAIKLARYLQVAAIYWLPGRISWADAGRDYLHRQQAGLPSRLLSLDERGGARSFSRSLPSNLCLPFGEDYGEAVVRYIEDEISIQDCSSRGSCGYFSGTDPGRGRICLPTKGFFPALRKLCDHMASCSSPMKCSRAWDAPANGGPSSISTSSRILCALLKA